MSNFVGKKNKDLISGMFYEAIALSGWVVCLNCVSCHVQADVN